MSKRPRSLAFLSVVLLAGVLGGTAAYRVIVPASSAESAPRESLVVDAADKVAGKERAGDARRSGFAPCQKPARLEGGRCVTDVVRTVTVPGASAAAAAPPPAPAPAGSSGVVPDQHHGGDDDSGHHHGGDDDDDDHGHHGGDDGDHSGHHGGDDDSGHHGDDDDDDDDDDHHGEDD